MKLTLDEAQAVIDRARARAGHGAAGHAGTNNELVQAARAQLATGPTRTGS